MRGAVFLLAGSCALSACSSLSDVHNEVADASESFFGKGVDTQTLIPDRTIGISPSVAYPLEKIVYWGMYAAVAYWVLDPLAPNWEIEEARLDERYVHFNLKMKRYYAGGAGEARQVFNRRAKELMRKGGFASYQVMEYTEGIDSSVLGSQRKAEGVIRLIPKS